MPPMVTPRRVLLRTAAASLLALAACAEPITSTPAVAVADPYASLASSEAELAPERATLALPQLGQLADAQLVSVAARAINPADYVCSSNSAINSWIDNEISKSLTIEQARFLTAYNYLADLIPTYEAVYFQTTATPQYFGQNGEHTKTINKAERELKKFWDIESSDIQVVAMHGNVLVDTLRTARTYQLFGYSAVQAAGFARTLRNAIVGSATMVDGNHPFFTFNAVAFTTFGGSVPDKIVMGDGILAGYDAIGFGDVAPTAIFAHEFAHHVQFENGYGITATQPEMTRFNELGADAMAAYYLTHKRGGTLNKHRVQQFLEVFYQIGDCAFTNDGHHGTPNQRLKAAQFGFDLADGAQKQGHIMSAEQVQAAFVAAYPSIVAPDAH